MPKPNAQVISKGTSFLKWVFGSNEFKQIPQHLALYKY